VTTCLWWDTIYSTILHGLSRHTTRSTSRSPRVSFECMPSCSKPTNQSSLWETNLGNVLDPKKGFCPWVSCLFSHFLPAGWQYMSQMAPSSLWICELYLLFYVLLLNCLFCVSPNTPESNFFFSHSSFREWLSWGEWTGQVRNDRENSSINISGKCERWEDRWEGTCS
jgi:hypothetical protein